MRDYDRSGIEDRREPSLRLLPLDRRGGLHQTAMIDRPGRILRWFYRRFFSPIAFPAELQAQIANAAERATIVYVCRTLSYIDYLYFSYALLTHGLPLSRFANGVRTLLMQPLRRVIRDAFRLWRERRAVRGE